MSTHMLQWGWFQCLWIVVTTFSISHNFQLSKVCFRLMLFSDWDNLVTHCWLVAHMQEIEVIAGCIVLLKVGPTEEIWQHTSHVKNSLRCINDCVVKWCAPSSVACANYLLMLSSSYSRSNLMRSFPRELELLLGLIEKKSNCLWFHLGKSL